VFAVIDTASKTGTENDATAVTFFARDRHVGHFPLMILDWDIAQIERALLETLLLTIFERLEELSRFCRARNGSIGAFIEDKTPESFFCSRPSAGNGQLTPSNQNGLPWTRMSERSLCPAVYRGNVNTPPMPFVRPRYINADQGTLSSIRSKISGLATKRTSEKASFWIRSVTASRLPLEMKKVSEEAASLAVVFVPTVRVAAAGMFQPMRVEARPSRIAPDNLTAWIKSENERCGPIMKASAVPM
jgi:hypothetical protein